MVYIFSWITRQNPTLMRVLLGVRSGLYMTVGNIVAVVVGVVAWSLFNNFTVGIILFLAALLLVATIPKLYYLRLLQTYMMFRRRWPNVYYQSGIRRLVDDGQLIRPVMMAPKLGEFPTFDDGQIVLTVRPAVGSTLKHLAENVDVLAAAFPQINTLEILSINDAASKGTLALTPTETKP